MTEEDIKQQEKRLAKAKQIMIELDHAKFYLQAVERRSGESETTFRSARIGLGGDISRFVSIKPSTAITVLSDRIKELESELAAI